MENLFESLNHADSIFFLLSVIISFLIGFIAAWAMWSGQAKRYQREAANWKKKYDDQNLELVALQEKLDIRTADLVKAKRESDLALEQAATIQNEKLKWQKDLDSSLEETVKLQASNYAYQSTIEDLNNQLMGLKAHNEQLALGASNSTAGQAEGTHISNGASSEQLAALEAQIVQLTADNEALRSTAKKEDENVINLLQSYKDTTNRLGGLEEKLGALVAENEALRAELATQKTAIVEVATATVAEPSFAAVNPADKEAITSNAITPSDATTEVLAAIGSTIPTATADQKDDLTEIKGIGSFLEKKLNALGIYTFEQVSHLDANLVDKLTAAIEFFPGRIERDDWVGQASRLVQASAAAPSAAPAKPDDLKIVEGIGPKIELLLFGAGIHTWAELANTSVERLQQVLHQAGDRFKLHDPTTWPEQAKLAADGDFDKLKEYQDFLSGGKSPDKA